MRLKLRRYGRFYERGQHLTEFCLARGARVVCQVPRWFSRLYARLEMFMKETQA
jgi:hypothetical protein